MSSQPQRIAPDMKTRGVADGSPYLSQMEKRDGRVVSFDRSRIERAIEKACMAVGEDTTFIPLLVDVLLQDLEQMLKSRESKLATVEQVQDAVERALMTAHKFEVAKAYVIYRAEHARLRHEKHQTLINSLSERGLMVKKNDGTFEAFDLAKIERVFARAVKGHEKRCKLEDFLDAFKKNIVSEMETKDINRMLIKTAIDLVSVENIEWQHIAARILLENLYKKAGKNRNMGLNELYSGKRFLELFDDYIERGFYYKDFYKYYTKEDILKAGEHLSRAIDDTYEYTTVLSLSRRYLLNPNGVVKELPQEMYMAVGLFLAIPEKPEDRLAFALKIYEACANQLISLPTPTLLNSRTNYHQLSSCFKINVGDDLRAIYHAVENIAQISKFGGGVGVYLGNIRSKEGMIRGIKGASAGVTPWIKVINDTAIAVNQLGARVGAVSVTLDVWHRDIHEFLDLQTETGDIRKKSFDIFPAIAVPDLFMKRVAENGVWTLLDPNEVERLYGTKLQDTFGAEFEAFYEKIEKDERVELKLEVSAKELMKKFLRTVVETGMPYVFFRDTVNRLNPNSHAGNVYSTQLCTEICQNTSSTSFKEETVDANGEVVIRYTPGDTVVCNLASINVAKVNDEETIKTVMPTMMRLLDNVITLTSYPIKESWRTSMRYRPVGVGYLGLAEYLATRHLAYDTEEARTEVKALFERYGYHTYRASIDLAKERGHYELFPGSAYSKGILLGRPQSWYEKNTGRTGEWVKLFADMKEHGVRFGYHTAPAPNTSTAGIVGTTAALLPIYKRFFVENNVSSQTIRVAPKLSRENYAFYKEYITLNMNDVIDMMAEIYPWVDQSISFEWMINPARTSPQDIYSYYFRAWEKGIKTVYYVRSLSLDVNEAKSTTTEDIEKAKQASASAGGETIKLELPITPAPVVQAPEPVAIATPPVVEAPVQEPIAEVIQKPASVRMSPNVCESCSG